eukprot:8123867-Alexandrium_andersonii.AAC.1
MKAHRVTRAAAHTHRGMVCSVQSPSIGLRAYACGCGGAKRACVNMRQCPRCHGAQQESVSARA